MNDLERALQILGITKLDTIKEARAKYKKLILKYHPDRFRDVNEEALKKTQEINWAFDIIADLNMPPEQSFDFILKKAHESVFSYSVWDGKEKNEKAFIKRAESIFGPGGYYYWDPEFEEWEAFTLSVEAGIRNYYEELVRKITGVDVSRKYGIRREAYVESIYTVFASIFRDRLYYYVQQEFVRPYYCLGKLIKEEGKIPELTENNDYLLPVKPLNKLPRGVAKSKGLEVVGKRPFEFSDAVVKITLECPSVGNRTAVIESLKIGDELQLNVHRDHPIYPSEVEAFTIDGKSVGRLPISYCICLGPMLLRNQITAILKVTDIQTREMRGPRARVAYATVNMFLHVQLPINDDVSDNNKIIQFYVDKATALIKLQKDLAIKKSKTLISEYFCDNGDNTVYDHIIWANTIIFSEKDYINRYYKSIISADKAFYELPFEVMTFICELYNAIDSSFINSVDMKTNRKKIYCNKFVKYSIIMKIEKSLSRDYCEVTIFIYENRFLIE